MRTEPVNYTLNESLPHKVKLISYDHTIRFLKRRRRYSEKDAVTALQPFSVYCSNGQSLDDLNRPYKEPYKPTDLFFNRDAIKKLFNCEQTKKVDNSKISGIEAANRLRKNPKIKHELSIKRILNEINHAHTNPKIKIGEESSEERSYQNLSYSENEVDTFDVTDKYLFLDFEEIQNRSAWQKSTKEDIVIVLIRANKKTMVSVFDPIHDLNQSFSPYGKEARALIKDRNFLVPKCEIIKHEETLFKKDKSKTERNKENLLRCTQEILRDHNGSKFPKKDTLAQDISEKLQTQYGTTLAASTILKYLSSQINYVERRKAYNSGDMEKLERLLSNPIPKKDKKVKKDSSNF